MLDVVFPVVVFDAARVDVVPVEREDVLPFGRPPAEGFVVDLGFDAAAGFDPDVAEAFDAVLRVRGVAFTAGLAAVVAPFVVAADVVAALLVESVGADFRVDRRVVGFAAVPAALAAVARVEGLEAVEAFEVVAVVAVFGRLREPGGRPRRRGAGVAAAAGLGCRSGVTTWLACTAADPTVRAAPPTAPPTASAAEDAADTAVDAAAAANEATRDARCATSDSDSATCLRRFATCLRPFVATAVASCRTRLLSVFLAAASCFSSLRSSLPALLESGATTPLASTITSATVSTTTSRRPFDPPSPRFAIDDPPAVPRAARPSRGRGPNRRSGPTATPGKSATRGNDIGSRLRRREGAYLVTGDVEDLNP